MSDATPAPTAGELSLSKKIAYGVPQFVLMLSGALIVPWLTYLYVPPALHDGTVPAPLVPAGLFAAVMLGGRIVDAVADPLIGHLSDRSRSPHGRRRPFIAWGTPVLMVSFFALFFPPAGASVLVTTLYLAVVLTVFWAAFTAVVAPYAALLPEIAVSSNARVGLSAVMAVFMVLGVTAGAVGVGPLQSALPDGTDVFGWHVGSGVQLAALVASVAFVTFLLPVACLRETPYDERKRVPAGLWSGLVSAGRNPAFQTFVGIAALMQFGLTLVVTSFPYMAKEMLEGTDATALVGPGEGERWTGYLLGLIIVGAVVWIPVVRTLASRWGKKRVMLLAAKLLAAACATLGAVGLFEQGVVVAFIACALMSFPSACAIVLINPMYADVVDADEKITGVRREGIYTGAMAVLNKTAIGVSGALAIGFVSWRNTDGEPLGLFFIGPIAAVAMVVGARVFRRHPID